MRFNVYQEGCLRTWNAKHTWFEQVMHAALGLAGEGGEVAETLKKHFFHGRDLDRELVKLELGDALYHVAVLARLYDFDLEDVAIANADKLRKRYPDGFSEEDSQARRDVEP